MSEQVSRRSFVKALGTAGLGLAAFSREIAAEVADSLKAAGKNIRNFKPTMKYREIGKTGVHVSAFSIGTTRGELEAISAGLDMGVNFIHTSARYLGGQAIGMVAKAIKGRTDKVHIGLKDGFDSPDEVLKALGVKNVDFVFFARHDPDRLRDELPDLRERFLEWKEKGLVSFAGITSHKNMAACIDVALQTDWVSCVMPGYGPKQLEELGPQREALLKKGMSVVAMKTKGEVSDEQYPAQITAALSDKAVSTVCRGVKTLEEVNAWTAAANSATTGWLAPRDDAYHAAGYKGCAMCGACERACPNAVAVADIVRCVRYYHGAERDARMAAAQFVEMGLDRDLSQCGGCGSCDKACPQGIGVRVQIEKGRSLWMGETRA